MCKIRADRLVEASRAGGTNRFTNRFTIASRVGAPILPRITKARTTNNTFTLGTHTRVCEEVKKMQWQD